MPGQGIFFFFLASVHSAEGASITQVVIIIKFPVSCDQEINSLWSLSI